MSDILLHETDLQNIVFRSAHFEDLPELSRLFYEHAAHEKLTIASPPEPERMAYYLLNSLEKRDKGVRCLVISNRKQLAGYAVWSPEFSTWQCRYYLHMDCLYLRPPYRRRGIGKQVMTFIREDARKNDFSWIEWQTPPENTQAIAFYHAVGAKSLQKYRFSLKV